MKRIFIAVDISHDARKKVSDYIETLGGEFRAVRVGWERAEKLHLTLKFLGDTEENQLQSLSEAVAESAKQISDFKLQISETGVFPSKRNAKILWLGLKDAAGNLRKLNDVLETNCEAKGFAKETRNFKAHLTIARLREPRESKELVERHLENAFESDEFEACEIVIYESRLQKSGSVYSIVAKEKFAYKTHE